MQRFIAELRRRHVVRVGVVYLIVAWAMIQVSATTFPMLGLPGWAPTLVLALLAVGFPIALALTWAYDVTPDGLVKTPARAEVREPARGSEASPQLEARAALDARSPTPDAQRPSSLRSLAILPFADLSRERDQEYLGDGIAEEILNVLAGIEDLRVAARTSSFAFKGRNVDVRDIGRQLGVDAIVEGSVRTAGNRLRVTAQLIGVHDGMHVWSRRFEGDLSDVFAVQDEIAAEIASALEVGRPAMVSAKSATQNLDAYEAYLRGRHFFHRKTGRSLRIAQQLFDQAIARDATYAPAYAGLADTSSLLYMYWAATEENRSRADECSARALEYGPQLAEAHVSRGLALSLYRRFAESAREFAEAIRLNPRLYDAWYFSARACFTAGDHAAAAERFARAAEIQPESYDNWGLLSQSLAALGRKDDERAALRRAVEAAETTLRLNPDDVRALYFMAGALVSLGEVERGVAAADRAAAMDPDDPGVHYNVACAYANAGRIERALDHLERALELGYGSADWMDNDPDLAAVRGHPRYPDLLARMRRMQAAPIDA